MNIPISKIIPNPQQPRKEFNSDELEALSESILQHGLINPISVEQAGEQAGEQYILIDGERRWRAAQHAGLTEIEASVRPAMNGSGERDRLVLAIVANVQRADMNHIDKAKAFWALRQQGLTTAEIARQVNLSQSMVLHYISLLELDDEIQDLFLHGELPFDFDLLKCLKSISDPEQRINIARTGAQQKLGGPGIVRLIKRMGMAKQAKRTPVRSPASMNKLPKVDAIKLAGGHWNMIAQLGYRPSEPRIVKAAETVCENCPLYDDADSKNCRDCPAVELLRKITTSNGAH